ncbi:MAG TPA: DUF1801 domain-containing protein [Anseongella sp.]|nr:DUF1801 domain-containing protein [Anseongella sp.]
MTKSKTTETAESVTGFLNSVADEKQRNDSFRLAGIMKEQTGYEPRMWGPSIVGFGSYHYKYASGHGGDAPLVGFSPRKNEFPLYLAGDFTGKEALLSAFGRHRAGKACIYIKKLGDIDTSVLRKMIDASVSFLQERYPSEV